MTQPFDNRDWDLRKIAEKDVEIERLKQTATDLQRECEKRGNKIADLERLIIRAAYALDAVGPVGWKHPLIAELRKAAQ